MEDYFSHNGFIKQAKRLGIVSATMKDDEIPAQVIDWAFNPKSPEHEKARLIVDTGIETLATALAFYISSRNTNLEIRLGGGLISSIEESAWKHGYMFSPFDLVNIDQGYFIRHLTQAIAKRINLNQPGHTVRIRNEFANIAFGDYAMAVPNLIGAALLAQNALNPQPKLQVLV